MNEQETFFPEYSFDGKVQRAIDTVRLAGQMSMEYYREPMVVCYSVCEIKERKQMETNLKSCPFCGADAMLYLIPYGSSQPLYIIECTRCSARIGRSKETYQASKGLLHFTSESEVTEAWNRRAEQSEIVRCKDCAAYGEMLTGRDMRMICHKFALNFPRDFYCAYAERRTDE